MRRLRNLINTAQADANSAAVTLDNANKLIGNADGTLAEFDKILDKVIEQGFIDMDIKWRCFNFSVKMKIPQ